MKAKVICVIMGGGRGTRLHPLTKFRCKPAVPLAGKYRLVDIPISNCLNSGYNQIYLLSQFNTASLHRHVQETYKFDPFSSGFVDILSPQQTEMNESWYQGTADAVRKNLCHFAASEHDIFLILSGDQLYKMDFRDLIEHHQKIHADITICSKPVLQSDASHYGIMQVNDAFFVTQFLEKPQDLETLSKLKMSSKLRQSIKEDAHGDYCLASMGIYVFSASALKKSLEMDGTDFGKEIIPGLISKMSIGSYIFNGYWEDIGTIGAFFRANLMLTDTIPQFNFFDKHAPIYTHSRYLPASKLNSCVVQKAIVSDGCIISNTHLNHCIIGVRSVINEGSFLENVVMLGADRFETLDELAQLNAKATTPPIGVGYNCYIRNAIIDKNARIGNHCHLTPDNKPDHYEKDGIFIRDGVLIITKNAVIRDNTIF